MIKPNKFFKRKEKTAQLADPGAHAGAAGSGGDEDEIIDLEEIIEDAAAEAGDDVLVASKLGLDVNLEDIDLDDEDFSKEFDAEQNTLLDAVRLDDEDESLKDVDLDAEFKALLGEGADAGGTASEPEPGSAPAAATRQPGPALGELPDDAALSPPEPELMMEPEPADFAFDAVPEPVEPVERLKQLDELTILEGPVELEVLVEAPQPGAESALEPLLPAQPTLAAATATTPRVDEALLDELLTGIEDRLQHAVRQVVAEQLPAIVREILREEIERRTEKAAP